MPFILSVNRLSFLLYFNSQLWLFRPVPLPVSVPVRAPAGSTSWCHNSYKRKILRQSLCVFFILIPFLFFCCFFLWFFLFPLGHTKRCGKCSAFFIIFQSSIYCLSIWWASSIHIAPTATIPLRAEFLRFFQYWQYHKCYFFFLILCIIIIFIHLLLLLLHCFCCAQIFI